MSSRGFSRALRAMSRSVGTAITYDSSYSGVLQAVYLDAELGARAQQHVEQVLAGGPLAVQQVGAGGKVVADHVGGEAGDRVPERRAVRRDVIRQVYAAELADRAGRPGSGEPDQCPAVGEIHPRHWLVTGLRGDLVQSGGQRRGVTGRPQQEPLAGPRSH